MFKEFTLGKRKRGDDKKGDENRVFKKIKTMSLLDDDSDTDSMTSKEG
jgi:hypothetical protein